MTEFLADALGYLEFGDDDRTRLVALHGKLAPDLPAIAQRFTDVIMAHAPTARLISGPGQLAELRDMLVDWMATGLLGPYDEAFHTLHSRAGRRHVTIGLPQHFMFTAMNVLRGEYDERIARLFPLDEAWRVMRSADKLLDLELALMLRHYQGDSEAKLVERERRNQADRLTAIQTLSAGLAHEVRNPLNSAKLQLELVQRRLRRDGDDPRLAEPIALAHHELARLTRMLNDFLAFARPPDLHLSEHDVVALARDVLAIEQALADKHGAELALVTTASVVATVDAGKLQQILHNLVRNAIEAVPRGGHVTVTLGADTGRIFIDVVDDGPGIPPEVCKRIYEPFFTTKETGTGLGMSIVHSMVTLHGGTIAIDSTERGTRFAVVMPRAG